MVFHEKYNVHNTDIDDFTNLFNFVVYENSLFERKKFINTLEGYIQKVQVQIPKIFQQPLVPKPKYSSLHIVKKKGIKAIVFIRTKDSEIQSEKQSICQQIREKKYGFPQKIRKFLQSIADFFFLSKDRRKKKLHQFCQKITEK